MRAAQLSLVLGIFKSDRMMAMNSAYQENKSCPGRIEDNLAKGVTDSAIYEPISSDFSILLNCAGAADIVRVANRPTLILLYSKQTMQRMPRKYLKMKKQADKLGMAVYWLCLDAIQ